MSRVTSKGQVTIPKRIRDAFGIEEGTRLEFEIEGEALRVRARPEINANTEGVQAPSSLGARPRHSRAYVAGSATPRGRMQGRPNVAVISGRALGKVRDREVLDRWRGTLDLAGSVDHFVDDLRGER